MFLINVIPLSRSVGKNTLSYFTSKELTPGTLVTVPVRKKEVQALVVNSSDASSIKTDIKNSSYGFKKVLHVTEERLFLRSFVEAATQTARFHATHTGAVIDALTPKTIFREFLREPSTFPTLEQEKKVTRSSGDTPIPEQCVFQASDDDRVAAYKSLLREEFARGASVFFCFPTIQDIETIRPLIERGVEQYVYILHSALSKKELTTTWKKLLKETHPVAILGTGTFLSCPRKDLGTLVLEQERGSAYILPQRPFIDIRTFVRFFARAQGIRLIVGDVLLRTETLYENECGILPEFSPLVFRALSPAKQKIVDMTQYNNADRKKNYIYLSDEIGHLITSSHANNERMYIYISRKGLYPLTLCKDCGEVVTCTSCSAPLVLHKKTTPTKASGAKNIFFCHACNMREESRDRCLNCNSWRFVSLGLGTELLEEEIKKKFPCAIVLRIDRNTATTKKKITETMNRFHTLPSAVLVGTELALPYLKKTAHIAIASLDSLFTIPDFRIHERVFGLLMRCRNKAGKNFLIQTRMSTVPLFSQVTHGNLLEFYRNEMKHRKKLNYPPFTTLIKITIQGTSAHVVEEMKMLQELCKEWSPETFPAFISKVRGLHRRHMLIRIDKTKWPDDNLLKCLYSLPPSFEIRVNPESIL